MLQVQENRSLKELTTFKIGGAARYFVEVGSVSDLRAAFAYARKNNLRALVLGGGSNMLISQNGYEGLVIRLSNRGIEEESRDDESILLRIGSGEVWDGVVQYAVGHDYWGIENLSRIPGRAGALAVQNVGAYGAEASQVLVNVEVYDRDTGEVRTLSNQECGFSYRKSIFNTIARDRYVILVTTLKLSLKPRPKIAYPDLKKRFGDTASPDIRAIRQAIKEIRDTKFPFPDESIEGNAGSFFKNVLLTGPEYEALEARFAARIPAHLERLHTIRNKFPIADGIKIPSAFILEACGLKQYSEGNVALNPTQPVVVLNAMGTASADEVLTLVKHVRATVEEKTGLHLLTEPELIGFSEEELRGYGFLEEEIARYVHATP